MGESDAGAWIFVSHSHKDIGDVRRVRDVLEAKGHNPLLFFLKCLDDSSELEDLIRREIDARSFFLLCDSANARASKWVQDELAVITSTPGKVHRSIDLGGTWKPQLDAIEDLLRQATIFISCAMSDVEVAGRYAEVFRSLDYRVLDGQDIDIGANWTDVLHRQIDVALANGKVVLLLSPDSLSNQAVAAETVYALQQDGATGTNVKAFVIRDAEEVLTLLSNRPEFTTIKDAQLFDATEIQFPPTPAELRMLKLYLADDRSGPTRP